MLILHYRPEYKAAPNIRKPLFPDGVFTEQTQFKKCNENINNSSEKHINNYK
jgi:hypothetical protein